jgi:hypothetical protein
MLTTPIVLAISLLAATAVAQTSETPSATASPASFESESPVDAKMFLPPDLLKGTLHSVRPQAENDGLLNTYFVDSGEQTFDVTTGIALRIRIRELYAIDKLRGMSKTDEFTKALKAAGKQKADSVVGLVKDPVGTLKRVPQGASRFFGRMGESMKGGGSESEGKALQNISGVQKAKVALAAKLGVSPYSTNQELQEQLNNTARAMAGGGLVLSIASMPLGGAVGGAITVVNVNQDLQETLVTSTPEDLRMANRKKLLAMGVSRANADELLMHPWYSPWHETIVVDALSSIGVNPTPFLQVACKALTEQDANYFQRLAQILARYHKTKAKLSSMRLENDRVCALDSTGTLVVPLSCDYAIWSEHAAGAVELFSELPQSNDKIKGLALWVDGKVSARAAEEMKNRKIDVATEVLAEPAKTNAP